MNKNIFLNIKDLTSLKILFSFFILPIIPAFLTGQTLISFKTGINWTNYRDINRENTFYGYPAYGFGIDIKGRKPTVVHCGASIEFYRNSFNWGATYYDGLGDKTPTGQNIHYSIEWLRLSIFPEIVFGKRFQVNFNLSPYVSIKLHSYKNGTSWTTDSKNQTITHIESGSANGDFTDVDIGFKENMGVGFAVLPYLILSLEENYGLGINTVNKVTDSFLKTKSLCVFFCTSFIIPASKSKEKNKSDDTTH